MQKPQLQFGSEEELRQFLMEAEAKKDDEQNGENEPEEWYSKDPRLVRAAEPERRQGMNLPYHFWRSMIALIGGVVLMMFGSSILTALGAGCIALAVILHMASMSIQIREDLAMRFGARR